MLFARQHEEVESIALLGCLIMSDVLIPLIPKEYLCTDFRKTQRLGRNGQNLLGNVDQILRILIRLFCARCILHPLAS